MACAIAVSTPATSRIRPKPPPAPTTSRTLAIGGSDSSAKVRMRSRLNPHAAPKVTSASSVDSSIAISGVPANSSAARSPPTGSTTCASAAASISSTGIRIVSSVTASDGGRRGRRAVRPAARQSRPAPRRPA